MSRSNRLLAVYSQPEVIDALADHGDLVRLFPACNCSCTVWHRREAYEAFVYDPIGGSNKKLTLHRWAAVDGNQHDLPSMLHCPPEEHDARLAQIVDLVLRRAKA